VIGPGHAGGRSAAPSEPTAEELWGWSLTTARWLTLKALDKPDAPEPWKEVERVWDIARGRRSDNPSPTAGRSNVKRVLVPGGKTYWSKHFSVQQQSWQINETNVLHYLKVVDRDGKFGLRLHVCSIRDVTTFGKGTSLEVLETWDGGPNLDSWRAFAPCSLVEGLALPLFVQPAVVAGIARQALIGLEKLAAFGVVHNDLKPNNLCLALPTEFKRRKGIWQGHHADLRSLPLRILDFEGAFARQSDRLVQAHSNGWVSPFARACHSAAAAAVDAGETGPKIQALLAGIDWGADLWSLGHMLVEWKQEAQEFFNAWLDEARQAWGDNSATYDHISAVVMAQAGQWRALQVLAEQLMAADRPVSDAGRHDLRERTDRPHDALWRQLERSFPVLSPGAKPTPLVLSLIDPSKPASFRPARPWGPRAQAWMGRVSTGLRRHAGAGLAGTAAVAVGAAVWASADVVSHWAANWAGAHSARIAAFTADGWRAEGSLYRLPTRWLAAMPAARAGVLGSAMAEPAWVEPPANAPVAAKAAYAADARQRSLRALAQWALAGGPADELDGRTFVQQMLLKLYKAQNRLEDLGLDPSDPRALMTDLNDAEQALAWLGSRAGQWPLATLMQLRLWACHAADGRGNAMAGLVSQLAGLPKDVPSAADYRSYAHAVQERLSRGAPPCLNPITQASSPP
jgi:hypothetical protein